MLFTLFRGAVFIYDNWMRVIATLQFALKWSKG